MVTTYTVNFHEYFDGDTGRAVGLRDAAADVLGVWTKNSILLKMRVFGRPV